MASALRSRQRQSRLRGLVKGVSRESVPTVDSVYRCHIQSTWKGEGLADDLEHDAVGFEWDDGNKEKNWIRHGVSQQESEQIFFNRPLVVQDDELHSDVEPRFYALGRTDANRLLFVVYTLRGEEPRVRIISARDMTPRERREYEHVRAQAIAEDSEV